MSEYLTIAAPATAEINVLRSRFIAFAYPAETEEACKTRLAEIKSMHHQASHHCYAFRLGFGSGEKTFFSDHGEPSGSAGKPILGVILKNNLTDLLIIVVRYFGGKKLGVRGLIEAYGGCAQLAINQSEIIRKTSQIAFSITCNYSSYQQIIYLLRLYHADILEQAFQENIILNVKVNDEAAPLLLEGLRKIDCSCRRL